MVFESINVWSKESLQDLGISCKETLQPNKAAYGWQGKAEKEVIMNYKKLIVTDNIRTVLDEQTKEKLTAIVMNTNAFLEKPLTPEQAKVLIESIIDFYFSHDDDVEEFKDFISYMAGFMEILADNLKRGGICE